MYVSMCRRVLDRPKSPCIHPKTWDKINQTLAHADHTEWMNYSHVCSCGPKSAL